MNYPAASGRGILVEFILSPQSGGVLDPLGNKLGGTLQLNIFYHTDTIAVFLWLIVGLTGLYIFLFFQLDFDGSYAAILKMDSQIVARTVRSVHRYASGAAVIISLLHAYRTLFTNRFRGSRWLAWVTGIGMGVILWLDGVTGYWLIWDQRAQVINDTFITFLNRYFGNSGDTFALALINAQIDDTSWIIMLWIFVAHILLFGIVALFFWWHILRLNKAKLFPPQLWMIGTGAVIVLASLFFPANMLPQVSFTTIPGTIELDPFFSFLFSYRIKLERECH